MALPQQSDIVTMDFPSRGGPFIEVPAKSAVDATTLDYPSRGLPFFAQLFGAGVAATIIRVLAILGAGF